MLNDNHIPSDIKEKMINYIPPPKKRNKRIEVRSYCEHFNEEIKKDNFDNADENRKNAKKALIKLIMNNGWDTEIEELQDAAKALNDSSSHLILSKKIRPKKDVFDLAMSLQSDIELIDEYIKLNYEIKDGV